MTGVDRVLRRRMTKAMKKTMARGVAGRNILTGQNEWWCRSIRWGGQGGRGNGGADQRAIAQRFSRDSESRLRCMKENVLVGETNVRSGRGQKNGRVWWWWWWWWLAEKARSPALCSANGELSQNSSATRRRQMQRAVQPGPNVTDV